MKLLTLAVPKGRILQDLLPFFAKINLQPEPDFFNDSSRKLFFATNLKNLQIIKVRSFDVATFVKFGGADLGICGFDVLTEFPSKQVFSVLELDTTTIPGGYRFDGLRDALAVRIRAIPEFREKLSDGPLNIGHPVWVRDDDFDIDRHLHRITLPAPGTQAELTEVCGRLAGLPLDRGRPLWEMWVIEGLADGFGALRVVVAPVGAAFGEGVAGGADSLHCVAILLEQVFGTGAVQVDGRFGHEIIGLVLHRRRPRPALPVRR
jgi:hypothetical protein